MPGWVERIPGKPRHVHAGHACAVTGSELAFISELVIMMTSSDAGQTSLTTRYTIRRRLASLFWNSLVTEKNTSVASFCKSHPKPEGEDSGSRVKIGERSTARHGW